MTSFLKNVRDLPASLSLSGLLAGLLVVVTGYTGPILLVIVAAQAGNLTDAQTASWILACAVGNGILTILQSLYYRQPITAPWSTAGVALLTTTLPNITIEQAVGAYIVCAVIIALIGMSGLFGRAMALVPLPVVAGLIAGILYNFGKGVYAAIGATNDPILVGMVLAMIATFFVLKRFDFRAPTLGALLVGTIIAVVAGKTNFSDVRLEIATPIFFMPQFDLNTIITLALPSVALALTSQYAPGQAVLRMSGYTPPINAILRNTGIGSVIIAFFGGHGATLGALTAAIVASPESQPDPDKRYASAVASGFFYIVFGLFGTTIFALFAGLPKVLVDVVAGLALTGTIISNLTTATSDPDGRDAGIAAFLCTASGMTFLGIAAPFWGLVLGMVIYAVLKRRA
jgi:benzoate membrane transport protein